MLPELCAAAHEAEDEVEELHCLLVDCEEGQLAVVKVSSALLLGMLADKEMEPGLLKAKIVAMQELLLAQRIDTLFQ